MLSLALASCGMSDSKRALAGINDASPVIGGGDGPRRILNDWWLKISQSYQRSLALHCLGEAATAT
jgi:hypothetical protein